MMAGWQWAHKGKRLYGWVKDARPGDAAGTASTVHGISPCSDRVCRGGDLHRRRSPAVAQSRMSREHGKWEENRAMKKLALLLVAIGPMIALPAVAQTPGAAERARVAGTVEKLDGDRLSVNVAGSGIQSVMLSADAQIYGVEKRRLGDIKPGDFVDSGGVRGTDGKIHAVELRIFPESMRGVGEGQRPWDVKTRRRHDE